MISNQLGFTRRRYAGDFAEHKAILTAIYDLAGRGDMIDLGCGAAHVTKNFRGVLVDEVVQQNPNLPVAKMDLRNAPDHFQGRDFNLLVMTDVLEHLTDKDARKLLDEMDLLCRAMVIFTPVGPWLMDPKSTHPDVHKSAWTPEQFWADGWEVLEYPTYHRYEGGQFLGAFWAWKFRDKITPTVDDVFYKAGIDVA